ncbi:trafficking protein particle complex subunit 13-like [Grammomys surdaster]|uniref:trafficking protein particle complex subunit 13-like n=1 Tax=Grammomys surdaster TaxID=491861 RepID=UPI00109F66A2|nr:trafficking protein particle complex subunit 13-like [Grammomys surdaster]
MFLRNLCVCSPSQPLDVKIKFYNSDKDDLFLEVHIQNISPATVFIQDVSLELPEMYTPKPLNTLNLDGKDECTFGTRIFLQATEGRYYLYHLQVKEEYLERARNLSGLTKMGELKIVWKRDLGEMAMLYTVPLEREAKRCGALKLFLLKIPDTVVLEEPFQITCKITNCSDKRMNLIVRMHNTSSVHWFGRSGSYLGKLIPGSSTSFTLTLKCLQLGLRRISGLQIIDTTLKIKYRYDSVANVSVVPSMDIMES